MAIPGGYDETLAQMAQEMADLQKKANLMEQKIKQMQDIVGGEKKAAPKKKDVAPKDEKRIARLSAVQKKQIADLLKESGVPADEKAYKLFRDWINTMADDEFKSCGLEDHMKNFAKNEAPAAGGGGGGAAEVPPKKKAAPKKKDVAKEESDKEEAPKKVPAKKAAPKKKDAAPEEEVKTVVDLKKIKDLKEIRDGVFQGSDNKVFTGPAEDTDEDMEDATFEGVNYVIGTKTQRVYRVHPDGESADVFVGFWGVGKFAGADL
jgi:hypothetical protein